MVFRQQGVMSVNTIFILLICLYVTVKIIFFIGIYIGTRIVEKKALAEKRRREEQNQVIDLEAHLQDAERQQLRRYSKKLI